MCYLCSSCCVCAFLLCSGVEQADVALVLLHIIHRHINIDDSHDLSLNLCFNTCQNMVQNLTCVGWCAHKALHATRASTMVSCWRTLSQRNELQVNALTEALLFVCILEGCFRFRDPGHKLDHRLNTADRRCDLGFSFLVVCIHLVLLTPVALFAHVGDGGQGDTWPSRGYLRICQAVIMSVMSTFYKGKAVGSPTPTGYDKDCA